MWEQGYLLGVTVGGRLSDVVIERSRLVMRAEELCHGRARTDKRPHGLERRRHPDAL